VPGVAMLVEWRSPTDVNSIEITAKLDFLSPRLAFKQDIL
jgi:hypothetical protein